VSIDKVLDKVLDKVWERWWPCYTSPMAFRAFGGKSTKILSMALLLAVLAAFSPILRSGFIDYDDPARVTANPRVQQGLTPGNVAWAFTSTEQYNWHPLTWISHMLDCQIFGLRPWGHHLTSVLLHAVNTVLLFLLLRSLLWRGEDEERTAAKRVSVPRVEGQKRGTSTGKMSEARSCDTVVWPIFFVAVLFGLHPIHVESVGWIS